MLDNSASLFLVLEEMSMLFSAVDALMFIHVHWVSCVFLSTDPCQHLLLSVLCMIAIVIVFLICISLTASHTEQFCLYFITICISFFESCLLRVFSHFLTGLVVCCFRRADMFWILILCHIRSLQVFFCKLVIHCVDYFL